jgi:glutathione S-transferase
MDLLARIPGVDLSEPALAGDIRRIGTIWTEARERFGAGGPYLFGSFTIADAMYAPVAARFRTYGVTLPTVAEAYAQALLADPDVREWDRKAEAMEPPEPLPA